MPPFVFSPQKDEVYLNLVLDFVPETVYRVARHFNKSKTTIPIIYVKVSLCNAACPLLLCSLCTYTINNNIFLSFSVSPVPSIHLPTLFSSFSLSFLRCICISYFAVWRIFIPKVSVTETSNHRIYWWTQTQLYSNCVTLAGVCQSLIVLIGMYL